MSSSRESSQPRDLTLIRLHLLHWQAAFFFFLPLAPPWNPQKDPRAGVGEGALGRGVPQGRLCQVKEQQEQDLVRSE